MLLLFLPRISDASLLLLHGSGCGLSIGRRGGVGSVISIELLGLQCGEDDLTMCGLLEGLTGGCGGVILTVGGINCLRPPALFFVKPLRRQ